MQPPPAEVEVWRREAAARWPALPVAAARPAGPPGTRYGAELVLVALALNGSREALRVLEHDYFTPLARALRKRWSPEAVDDALQALRERLLVAPRAHLRDWPALDQLSRWLRVCAIRELASASRARAAPPEPDSVISAGDSLNDRHLEHLRAALAVAVEQLEPAQRGILKLHLLENVSVESIARLHQVSRSTMTRWLADARATLERVMREEARAELQVGDNTLDSLARALAQKHDLSLAGLLKGEKK